MVLLRLILSLAILLTKVHSEKPEKPEICTLSNKESCECSENGIVTTYVFWPGDDQRCIHAYIPDEGKSGPSYPVLIEISGYNQGSLGTNGAVAAGQKYGFATLSLGSTGPFDGGGNFGLEFPANGVINPDNPAPCSSSDSREYAFIEGVLDWIESVDDLDQSKVYVYGFSQSSMFAAYVAVCFHDRIAGLWQGGSGLALTSHIPLTPGLQGQCSKSASDTYGKECCDKEFCNECAYWPIYPRTCGNKDTAVIVDCIAMYTNDFLCGTDYYMANALVEEGHDARLLSFSPSDEVNGGHKSPNNLHDWMVGCLGIVDSCSSACEDNFTKCVTDSNKSTGLEKFKNCLSNIGDLEGCEEKPCALTLEMLRLSEDPVVSLSQGKFGTSSSLPVDKITRPDCEKDFGSFADFTVNTCKPENIQFADGSIANCINECQDSTDTVAFTWGGNNEGFSCLQLSKKKVNSIDNICKKSVDANKNCPKTCESCSAVPSSLPSAVPSSLFIPSSKPTIVGTNNDPTLSPNPGFCGSECAAEWPNCVNFGNNSCESCQNELQNPSSILVKKGNCMVGCEPTDDMMKICGTELDPTSILSLQPTTLPSSVPSVDPSVLPSIEPSVLPITEECQDDETFIFKSKKNCLQLKKNKCKKWDKMSGMLVRNHCPEMCEYCESPKRCKDDDRFFVKKEESEKKYRCKHIPRKISCTDMYKKKLISERCRESCNFCEE